MNQRTHAWIAVRAVALLADEKECSSIVNLLKPFVKSAAAGAWLPDKRDAKIGGSDTDNHVLKMKPYSGPQQARFTVVKPELLKKLGSARRMHDFLAADKVLDEAWWAAAYKADPKPGQHLADRAGALATTVTDLLIMGDSELAALLPRQFHCADTLDMKCRTRPEQAAMYLFMQSHFIADACMPCHCDGRKLSSYDNGLHKELEGHWSAKIDKSFDEHRLQPASDSPDAVLDKARAVDKVFSLDFKNEIPDLVEQDLWLETIYICRGSFAVASIVAPPDQYPYHSTAPAPFDAVLKAKPELLYELDKLVLHDAVLNVATTWKHLWNRLEKEQQ